MNRRQTSLEELRKAKAQLAADRQKLLDRIKARQSVSKNASSDQHKTETVEEEAGSFDGFDIDAALSAAARLRLMALDMSVGSPKPLNRPTITLLRQFLQTMTSGESAVLLQWPFGQRDISLLHPLAMLALLCAPEQRTTGEFAWCEPAHDFRTLYFPWRAGATSASQRSLLIRRNEILKWNNYHLTRRQVDQTRPRNELDKLHVTIGHLNRLSRRDTTRPHLAHPTLAEIYPTFVAEGGEASPPPFKEASGELFGRVRYGAALDRMTDYRPRLSLPGTAPYGLFGVSSRVQPRHALSARPLAANNPRGHPPSICLLDLGPPALTRLGPSWTETVEDFISEARKRFPTMPFFAVTQDTFVFRKIAGMLRAALKPGVPRSRVLVRISRDPLSPDPAIETLSNFTAHFSTVAGPTADAVAALSEAARGSADPVFAGTLRREMGCLRKAASLPCGLGPAYEFLCKEIGQAATEAFLEFRSPGTLLAPLEEALDSEIGGAERARVSHARDAVQAAFDALNDETPIGSLLAEFAETLSRKSSRSLIAFASNIDRILGEHRLANDTDTGQAFRRRIDKGHITLASGEDLESKLTDIEGLKDRNSWKRLVLVAPSLDWLSAIAVRGWLPGQLHIICERTFASRVADVFHRLSSHPDLSGSGGLGERLACVAASAKAEAAARGVSSVDLDLDTGRQENVFETLIDLTDEDSDDETEIVFLTLASGRKLRARPGSTIIRYDENAEINPFERASAKDIKLGNVMVVPDQAFLQEAREVLPIRVLAQSWVEIYHSTVEAHLPNIPGNTLNAKARMVLADIRAHGARTQSQAAVLDWLRVEEHMKLPPEQRQPHAPQRRREFDAFMSVLGVTEALADKMWMEGIQPLRVDRRRAGQKMAQAFVSVLVDPHGTASGFDAAVRDGIATLRRKALDYVDQVVDVETIDIGGPYD